MTRLAPRDNVRARVVHVEPTDEQSAFPIDAWVSIFGRQGVFKVKGYARDGSISLYGGTYGRASASLKFRNAYPDTLRLAPAPIREDDE